MVFVHRLIEKSVRRVHGHSRGRIVVLTGARQCGKTTLATTLFPEYSVLAMDSPVERAAYARLSPDDWITRYPRAVVDEAHKLPEVFETLKACYDRSPAVKYVVLGSSQILLLKKVAETLAGRIVRRELFPFALPELVSAQSGGEVNDSRLARLLNCDRPAAALDELFPATLSLEQGETAARHAWEYFMHWGGMPRLTGADWTETDRMEWLTDYCATYLQRDLMDLGRLDRLEPFVRAEKAAALRTAQPLNYAELGRLADVSAPTARQYLRYLEISYQVLLLPAWYRNAEKRLVKRAKLHFLDPGVRRALLGRRGEPEGHEFESAVVAEVWKQCRTARLPVECSHLRTADGREVDLLIELDQGFVAVECKQSHHASSVHARSFAGLAALLDKPLLCGLIVSNDSHARPLTQTDGAPIWNVAAWQLLS